MSIAIQQTTKLRDYEIERKERRAIWRERRRRIEAALKEADRIFNPQFAPGAQHITMVVTNWFNDAQGFPTRFCFQQGTNVDEVNA